MKYYINILLFICINLTGLAQQWPVDPSVTGYNHVSCTFGEIHTAWHCGIDIAVPVTTIVESIQGGEILQINPNGENRNIVADYFNDRTACYMHVYAYSGIQQYTVVNAGDPICTVAPYPPGGQHLHFEMRYLDPISTILYYLNPLSNDYGWQLGSPTDNHDPQINDIIAVPLTGQNDPPSGCFALTGHGTGITNYTGNSKKIHFANTDCDNTSTGATYQSDSRLVVYGNIGFISLVRDIAINTTPCTGSANEGASVKSLKYQINNQDKYLVEFDRILSTETGSYQSVFHTQFNSGTDYKYGNKDFIELYSDGLYTYPEKRINNIQSNGIWATRANYLASPVFQITPTALSNNSIEAYYREGEHTVSFEARDAYNNVDNVEFTTIVDNFLPFIKKVEVFKTGVYSAAYRGEWQLTGATATFNRLHGYVMPGSSIVIKVKPSEKLENINQKFNINLNS
ncbi:MAG: M23 family metallopeptidase [Bacteroidota bacterium]